MPSNCREGGALQEPARCSPSYTVKYVFRVKVSVGTDGGEAGGCLHALLERDLLGAPA